MNMVLGQRAVYALDPASRARRHALYMISIFIGGAIGSALAGPLYEAAGWPAVMLVGACSRSSPWSPLCAESPSLVDRSTAPGASYVLLYPRWL